MVSNEDIYASMVYCRMQKEGEDNCNMSEPRCMAPSRTQGSNNRGINHATSAESHRLAKPDWSTAIEIHT